MSTDGQWDIVTGVGITALAVAAARAVETSRPAPLVEDPWAASFVTAAESPVPMPTTSREVDGATATAGAWAEMVDYAAVRTRAFDDHFLRAGKEGITQAVILAAGLDTRAFRLDWPAGTVVYEIDQPRVLSFKREVLRQAGAQPRCDRRPVPADLREDWARALTAAGFDPSRPTAWLAEGLLPYLPAGAEQRLFQETHRLSAPGSHLAAEYLTDLADVLADPRLEQPAAEMGLELTELLHTDARPGPADLLTALGWRTRTVSGSEAAASHGRPVSAAGITDHAHHLFARLG
ncbi:SAM-dependent methyltransferase [Streptomyces sp. NPDC059740]|uniref:SAM-dependent methyltransferase n=1 Tax=Streptomyces sp. NPDC059740 TaxID=3346926 RepID=UPI0036638C27